MKKNIKDYLHLYLGCEAIVLEDKQYPVVLESAHRNNDYVTVRGLAKAKGSWLNEETDVPCERVKPILRPLSDMTEEEVDQVSPYPHVFTPIEFHYLLSRHFDLFGLIDAGLAIDKATL